LLNIKQTAPDAIVVITYAKEGGRLMKQAREMNINLQFFGADPWTISDFLTIAGPAAEGVLYTTPAGIRGRRLRNLRRNSWRDSRRSPMSTPFTAMTA